MTRSVVSFQAMGTTGLVQIHGPRSRTTGHQAVALIEALERRWSRFLPNSDVSRINRSNGHPVAVHSTTAELLELALAAWRSTEGLFSPFLQLAMKDVGYRRSWSAPSVLTARTTLGRRYHPITPSDLPCPLRIEHSPTTATLEWGAGVDLGGIAKGHAADLVVHAVMAAGADGVLVDIGGDIAFGSNGSDEQETASWRIDIDDPFQPGTVLDSFTASSGGVATSSTLRRCWLAADGTLSHHLIDPVTGWSSTTATASVSVVADSCTNAEVLTKQLLLMDATSAAAKALSLGVDALIVDREGRVKRIGCWEGIAV